MTLLAPSAAHAADPSPWLVSAGRLHVALVHAPIGLLIAAAVLELTRLARRQPRVSPASVVCTVFGALGAGAAIASGWIHADAEPIGGRTASVVEWHRWVGVGAGSAAGACALLTAAAAVTKSRLAANAYSLLICAAAATVSVSAYLGARLVYGPGYFTEPWESSANADPFALASPGEHGINAVPTLAQDSDSAERERAALDVFAQRCTECHGPAKRKGGLRLDAASHILAKPLDKAVIVQGDPDASVLIYRVTLPADDFDAMPPEGERLTPEQVEIVRAWIAALPAGLAQGAGDAGAEAAAEPAVDGEGQTAPESEPSPEEASALERIAAAGGHVAPLSQGSADLDVDLSFATLPISDGFIASLLPLEGRVVHLNLARSAVSDGGMALVARFERLERLSLAETGVGDEGAAHLAGLASLRVLNVHHTAITDAGLERLAALPALRRVYVWGTAITPAGVERARARSPNVEVDLGSSPEDS